MLDFKQFQLLTFDCYGTLIDWESGLFGALRPIFSRHARHIPDDELLRLFGELEAEAESGPFQDYRAVLQTVVRGFGRHLGFTPSEGDIRELPESVKTWRPFADTVPALRRLQSRYKLAIISNVDDDIFAATAPKLEIKFDWVTTAQQARCYKPRLEIFGLALQKCGVARERILHVGQSVYHDVLPAQSLGISTVWVNRPSPRAGVGPVRRADGVPDLEVHSLEELVVAAGL